MSLPGDLSMGLEPEACHVFPGAWFPWVLQAIASQESTVFYELSVIIFRS